MKNNLPYVPHKSELRAVSFWLAYSAELLVFEFIVMCSAMLRRCIIIVASVDLEDTMGGGRWAVGTSLTEGYLIRRSS